ncbi:hypothetical protein CHS0354_023461 [Potamilus streckersoni]|uniref:Large ribosomal subunit protein mL46 n=1 Tax=Potamilus streckersoni TaxID=2493646 RepID=A0AAE0S3Y8_9BIVA|nr:hypothetical protein CHS0354_023461 [Potamilus streckersoni]
MFFPCCRRIFLKHARNFQKTVSSSWLQTNSSNQNPRAWQLFSAVCLERYPVITDELTPLESKFKTLMHLMEKENSLLSYHEKRLKDESIQAAKKYDDDDDETVRKTQYAVDLEDQWENEYNQFTPANRITDADRNNDTRSVNRKLDRKLIFIIKQKLGEKEFWVLPQGVRQESESMRQAAERVLQSFGGDKLKASFLGNAPCGFHKYKYPQSVKSHIGAKVFFYKASLKSGDIVSGADYRWVTKEELKEYLIPSYLEVLEDFILEL